MLVGPRQDPDRESGTAFVQLTKEELMRKFDKSLYVHLGDEAPEDVKSELTKR